MTVYPCVATLGDVDDPALSCDAIFQADDTSTSDTYYLYLPQDPSTVFSVFCYFGDMDIREIPQTMDSLLGVKEFAVSQLAESATTNAASRCGFMSGCSEECSHWACSNEHEGTCRTDFGTPRSVDS